MRKMDFISSVLALAEPVAVHVRELDDEVVTRSGAFAGWAMCGRSRGAGGSWTSACPRPPVGQRSGAESAVHAEVLVLHHDAAGLLERFGDVERLRWVCGAAP